MSVKLRECRQGLAAALDQATKEDPESGHCSSISPIISTPVLYISTAFSNDHPETLHSCGLCLITHNEMFGHSERPDYRCIGQGCRHRPDHFSQFKPEAEIPQDLPGLLGASSRQTLEELVAKLEFENELNRVCSRLKLNMNTHSPPALARGHSTGSVDSGLDEGQCERSTSAEGDDHANLLDSVLEMEQDYELYY
ncbi:uncharacterized protein C3orf62-like [Hoplias malabaricus]|uniref:uncharacterized protein C3orf62-like n=1 Tax=Hoplias malabaricus TaxID=27720 RepID=UPI00346320AA